MRRFLIHLGLFFGLPIFALAVFYFVSDPYRLFRPFSPTNYDVRVINRDQVSMDFFLYFNPKNDYNSFIFGSSRANGINSYHWKKYLPDDARQFLFQGYAQNISGIEDKVRFLEKNGNHIENALILIDIPSSFVKKQNPTAPDLIRDYRLSGQNKYIYHFWRFANFLRKPSEWKAALEGQPSITTIDTFSNEFGFEKRSMDITYSPKKEYLSFCSEAVRESTIKEIQKAEFGEQSVSEPLIDNIIMLKLQNIKTIFKRQNTQYKIIITPMLYPIYPSVNPTDLRKLKEIFGSENVYNYSGKNNITTDYCLFSDPLHFGQSAGWRIIEEIYAER